MNATPQAPHYACPLTNELRPPSPVIHDGSHTALEQRFEEEISREEERRFVFPLREKEKAGHGS
jgi:hypothetical protein